MEFLEEGTLGKDERLLVQGTQTRLRYGYGMAGACPHSFDAHGLAGLPSCWKHCTACRRVWTWSLS